MAAPKKKKLIDEDAPPRTFDISTPRGRRRVSLFIILGGLILSLLNSSGMFDDIKEFVNPPNTSGISNVPYNYR